MKKFLSVLFALVIVAASFGSAFADTSIPGGPFATSINLANVSDIEATVTIQYISKLGMPEHTTTHTIAAGDVLSIYVPAEAALASGEYSVIVSSSQKVAAIAQFSDPDSYGAYSGMDTGSTAWFVPGIYNDYYKNYSEVYAQNVYEDPQDITLEVFAPGSSTPVYTEVKEDVPAYASVNWIFKDLAVLSKNIAYSAKVTAASNIVVISNYYGSDNIAPQLYSFNAFSEGATKFNAPVIVNNYYGWNASISIQNVSSTEADVEVAYSTGKTDTYTIPSNSNVSIYVPAISGLPSGKDGLFGATITSNVDIAVVVNQSNVYNRAATYEGIAQESATTTVYAPITMKRYYNASSNLTCQNVGNAETTMELVYSNIPDKLVSDKIPAGGIWALYLPADNRIPNKYLGSATITSDVSPIACVVQSNFEDAPYNTQNMDALLSYTAYNQQICGVGSSPDNIISQSDFTSKRGEVALKKKI